MNKQTFKQEGKDRRHARVRAKIAGTSARPRLAVYKSNRYLHAQIIDDTLGTTLVAGSTRPAGKVPAKGAGAKKVAAASQLGEALAKAAIAAGITAVVFDRGGSRYTGRVAELANSARKGGLTF